MTKFGSHAMRTAIAEYLINRAEHEGLPLVFTHPELIRDTHIDPSSEFKRRERELRTNFGWEILTYRENDEAELLIGRKLTQSEHLLVKIGDLP